MDDGFIVKPLRKPQIDQAFPLVRAIAPDLAVDRWRAFAQAVIGRPGPSVAASGIMTVQNGQGYIHGLFSYAVDKHLRHGRILAVENFIVLDLFDASGAATPLLKAMESVARALGCTAIHTNLPDRYAVLTGTCGEILDYFRAEGHAVEALRLCKPIARANDNRSGAPAGNA